MSKRLEWLDNAVFYEIYPQSFLDTDGDGIGNINGITEKLAYIKELGCMDAEGPMATRKDMMDVIRFWLSKGCDGFRVDMAGSLVKNDEDSKGTIALWQDVRKILDEEFPNAAFVSEWGEPLVYMRTFNDEKILVVIIPSDKAAEIRSEHKVSELIYSFGREPEIKGNSIVVNGVSAFFATL